MYDLLMFNMNATIMYIQYSSLSDFSSNSKINFAAFLVDKK